MYKIDQVNYHYFHELTEFMDEKKDEGFEVVQVIRFREPSGDTEKMHRATILFKKI